MALLALLLSVAVAVFVLMYTTKRSDLGFVAAVFWFLAGTQAYTLRTFPVTTSMYWYIFFVCSFGMTITSVLSSMGMRRESTDVPDDTGRPIPSDNVDVGDGNVDSSQDTRPKRKASVRERSDRRRSRFGGDV